MSKFAPHIDESNFPQSLIRLWVTDIGPAN